MASRTGVSVENIVCRHSLRKCSRTNMCGMDHPSPCCRWHHDHDHHPDFAIPLLSFLLSLCLSFSPLPSSPHTPVILFSRRHTQKHPSRMSAYMWDPFCDSAFFTLLFGFSFPAFLLQEQHLLLHHGVVLEHAQRPRRSGTHHRAVVARQGHADEPDGDGAGFLCGTMLACCPFSPFLLCLASFRRRDREGNDTWGKEDVRFFAIFGFAVG